MKKGLSFMCALAAVLLTLALTACGGGSDGSSGSGNRTPVADAGEDQTVSTGVLVTLDGSGSSDEDGDTLTYNWSFTSMPAGSGLTNADLSDSTAINPTFIPDIDGLYVLSLTVNDGTVDSSADTVMIAASTTNSAPVADAGPDQDVLIGWEAVLDGSGSSDGDGDTLTYSWSFNSKPGTSTAALSGAATVSPTFTPDVDGEYVLNLMVNDGTMDSAADTVTVTAMKATAIPDSGQTTCYDTLGNVITCSGTGQDGDYASNVPSYTDNLDGTVTDNVTVLVWQKQDDAVSRGWGPAYTYCGSLSLPGSGWRLPEVTELMGILDYGRSYPAISETYFPNTQHQYWSNTDQAGATGAAWSVDFLLGLVHGSSMAQTYYVRCVRGVENRSVFVDNGDGSVTDAVANLTWQQEDDGATKTWESALTYCEGLTLGGFSWRLPNVKELRSLVDSTEYDVSIDTTFFPNTKSSDYWTSTTYDNASTSAWTVRFLEGHVTVGTKTTEKYVRCVR